jgi:hypothetical protein
VPQFEIKACKFEGIKNEGVGDGTRWLHRLSLNAIPTKART